MEKLKNNLKVKIAIAVAALAAVVISLALVSQVHKNSSGAVGSGNGHIADGNLEFQATDINGNLVPVSVVPIEQDVKLHVAITTDAEGHTGEDYVINMDNADFVIDGLETDGKQIELTSNDNTIYVTIDFNADNSAYDLIVTGWQDGTTLSFDLGGHKRSANTTTVSMTTNPSAHGGRLQDDITAYGVNSYTNNKTVDHTNLSISSDGTVVRDESGNPLTDNLTYVLRGNIDLNNAANATIDSRIKVEDTLNIPNGINIADLNALKSYLTVSGTGLTNNDITYTVVQADSGSDYIRQLKIEYTLDTANEVNDFLYSNNYIVELNAAELIKNYGTSIPKSGTVTIVNSLVSTYTTDLQFVPANTVTVSTEITKDQGPVYSYGKEITQVNDGAVTEYVKQGDTVTYKMTIDNTGLEAGIIDYTDYIPNDTEFVSASVNSGLSTGVSNATFAYDANTNSCKGTATIAANGKLVLNMTVRVTEDKEQNIVNTFFDKTVIIPEKPLRQSTIEKLVDKSYYTLDDLRNDNSITYRLRVTNTGAGNITNETVTDTLPNGITYTSVDVGTTGATSTFDASTKTITITGVNLVPGETKEFVVRGIIDGSVTAWIYNEATFMDNKAGVGVAMESAFEFDKNVARLVDGNRVDGPANEIDAYNGDSIEYTMELKNNANYAYDLTAHDVKMEDVIPGTIDWSTADVYYTIGDDETNHYTANITATPDENGTKLVWTIDRINTSTELAANEKVTLHVFGTINVGEVTTKTTIVNKASVPLIKQESTATINVLPQEKTDYIKYIYKIFDENGNKIYENTTGVKETDQSKIPLVGENYHVVYRTKITNKTNTNLTEFTALDEILGESGLDNSQLVLSDKYYDPTTGRIITGENADRDSSHFRINVYGTDNSYRGTFTTLGHTYWWGGSFTITTEEDRKGDADYEKYYSEGVGSAFNLGAGESIIFEYSIKTTDTQFKQATNKISNSNKSTTSETIYGKKTVNDIDKNVAMVSKSAIDVNKNYVDLLDTLDGDYDSNYLIYKVTFNTKGYCNDEIELTDTLDSRFSYVTSGVDGYNGLPIVKMTSSPDDTPYQWNTHEYVVDADNDTLDEDTANEYSVTTNGNTMSLRIKPSVNRKNGYKTTFTIYYLVKNNAAFVEDSITARNTASVTFDGHTVSDDAVVTVTRQKSYPDVTKQYLGSYGSATTMTGNTVQLTDHPNENSRLVWNFKIENDVATNSKVMDNYVVHDVLPITYEYDNVYRDSSIEGARYYPSIKVTRANGTSTTYSAVDGTYVEPTLSTAVIEGATRNVLSWTLNEERFNLNPGDSIEFNISCKLPGNMAKSSVAINEVYVIVNGDYVTDSNDVIKMYEGTPALFAEDFVSVGSANVTTSFKEAQIFNVGEPGYDYATSSNEEDHVIKARVGTDFTYKLNIKNDSPSLVQDLVVIDRLPYVGDYYMSTTTSGGRQSAYSIKFKNVVGAKIVDSNGLDKRVLTASDYEVDYSDCKQIIDSSKRDWIKGQSELASWHGTLADGDVDVRIAFNSDVQLDADDTIIIELTATVPEEAYIEASGESNIAWNNFGYRRTNINKTTGEVMDRLVAESAKVGVYVDKIDTKVTVNKVWDDNSNSHGIRPQSIRVQLMKRAAGTTDNYVAVGEPTTLSGSGNTWGITISGLPKYENGHLIDYTFVEVDENGSNPGNVDNYATSEPVITYDGEGFKVVTITNTEETGKLKINKIVKNRENDVTATTNEPFYFVIQSTTENKYLLHDGSNNLIGSETINSLTSYPELSKVLWTINPSQNASLEINDIILGKALKVIETKADGTIVTNSNFKYNVTYDPEAQVIASKDVEYTYNVTNDLKLIDVEVTKSWQDDTNKRNVRPSEITLVLYANDVPVEGKSITINSSNATDANTWKYVFRNLRKTDDNGNIINYTVREANDLSKNYEVRYSDATNDGTTIKQTITNSEKVGSINVTKQVMNYGSDITATNNKTYYFVVRQGNEGYVANDGSVKAVLDSSCIYSIQAGRGTSESYTRTISNLTYGKTYTVVETDENGGELNAANINFNVTYENQTIALENSTTANNSKIINTLKTTEKTAYKVWVDNNNKHGVRPNKVQLQLYADGVPCGDVVEIQAQATDTDSNTWSYVFRELKKYQDDGETEIVYTVRENNVDVHYEAREEGLTVTNTEKTGDINIIKQVVNNNVDITAQTERTFYFVVEQYTGENLDGYVKANGDLTSDRSQAILSIRTGASGDTDFKRQITGLAMEKAYKVTEVSADGSEVGSDYLVAYDSSRTMTLTGLISTGTTTVRNTLATTRVVVNKVWDDNNNSNGLRPDKIQVQLYAGETAEGNRVELPDTTGNWTYTWNDLKKYADDGTTLINYSVKEFDKDGNESISNYVQMPNQVSTDDNGKTITLTNKESLGGLTIAKYVLNTEGNAISTVPDEFKGPYYVTVRRDDNGKYIDAAGAESDSSRTTIEIQAGTSVNIESLPLTTYTVTETDSEGNPKSEDATFTNRFEISYSNPNQKVTIANSTDSVGIIVYNKIIEKTKLDVQKVWVDNNNRHNLRPTEVRVKLYRLDTNGQKIDTNREITLRAPTDGSDANTWRGEFNDLDKYDENGNIIKYTADEIIIPTNYVKETQLFQDVVGTDHDSVVITNTEEYKKLTVTKRYLNNVGTDITATSEATFNFVVEQFNGATSEGYVNENGAVSANKTIFSITTGPNAGNVFSQVIDNLTISRKYKVTEVDSEGNEVTTDNSNFEVSYTNRENEVNDSDVATTIVNKLKSKGLIITKRWIDNADHGLRSTIQATLKADDVAIGTYDLTAANNWTVSVPNLPDVRNDGITKIVYTVEENDAVIRYYNKGNIEEITEGGNGFRITNTEVYGTLNITKKLYNNSGEVITDIADNLRDKEYYFTVKRNETPVKYLNKQGVAYDEPQLISVKANETVSLINIALGNYVVTETDYQGTPVSGTLNIKDANNESIRLSVAYDNQTVELTKTNSEATTIIKNSITDTTNIPVKKVWNDRNFNLEHRPTAVKVELFANAVKVDEVTLTTADKVNNDDYNWAHTFNDLPKFAANGAKINYTISETYTEAEGEEGFYSASINQSTYTITNTPVPNNEKVTINIEKKWQGEPNENYRPQSIAFIIRRAGTNQDVRTVTLPQNGVWRTTITDLPKYDSALNLIDYEVYELVPNDNSFKFYDVSGATMLDANRRVIKTTETTENNFEITNTFDVPNDKVSLVVGKVWSGLSDYYDNLPDTITVDVTGKVASKQDNVYENTVTIARPTNVSTPWRTMISDLPKYDSETGEEIRYEATERAIRNYRLLRTYANYEGDNKSVIFANTPVKGRLKIVKKVLSARDNDISNTMDERYYFTVTFVKDGTTYYLSENGEVSDRQVLLSVATKYNREVWINNLWLDQMYTVTETDARGNRLTEANGDYIVTNGQSNVTVTEENPDAVATVENKLQDKEIVIEKTWSDQNNKYNKRPQTLSFTLRKSTSKGQVTVSSYENITVRASECETGDNQWKYTARNLPIRDNTGAAISYTLVENQDGLEWYYLEKQTSISGKNTQTIKLTNQEVYGRYSLQLNKVDQMGFAIPDMRFKINGTEARTDDKGKIIIVNNKEIYDDATERFEIEEVSNTNGKNGKKYVKILDKINLYVKKQRVNRECTVTGISFDGNVFNTTITRNVLLDNGGKAKVSATLKDDNITLTVVNIEQKPDLSLKKFISKVNDTAINTQEPIPTKKADGSFTYTAKDEILQVEDNDLITYTIRVYNEGNIHQYCSLVEDEIPQGLEFVEDNEINKKYGWKKVGNNVQTSVLAKDGFENAMLKAFVDGNSVPDSKDLQIVFKVVEPENSDRIVTNKAQIMAETDKDGETVSDVDSTPAKWIDGEDDQDLRSVRVKYFDLSLAKTISKVKVVSDGVTTTKEIKNSKDGVVKIDLKQSEIDKSVIKVEYEIAVKNEGEIAGTASEITDYLPNGFTFEQSENKGWTLKDGKLTTELLKDKMLNPGETAKVYVTLTWLNAGSNIGVKTNIAEISKDKNNSNTPDRDSTPNNKKPGEDDIDDISLMITVKTGGTMIGIQAANYVLAILTIATVVVIKLKDKRTK